jgi:hypothetical protein
MNAYDKLLARLQAAVARASQAPNKKRSQHEEAQAAPTAKRPKKRRQHSAKTHQKAKGGKGHRR